MNRRLLNELRHWKDTPDHKPIVLRGARQVGKTTLVRMFGVDFDNFFELNLERKAESELFEKYDDVLEFLLSLIHI